jgi:hypothetical protein
MTTSESIAAAGAVLAQAGLAAAAVLEEVIRRFERVFGPPAAAATEADSAYDEYVKWERLKARIEGRPEPFVTPPLLWRLQVRFDAWWLAIRASWYEGDPIWPALFIGMLLLGVAIVILLP